jgi:transcriptional regulator GlxA family with amidase domain
VGDEAEDVHLSRVFKQTTGQTIFQYLTHLRVERAKVLLQSTPLTSGEIARQTGFSSATLFGRTFRAMTGLTPGGYRARAASVVKSFPSRIVTERTSGQKAPAP